MASTDLEEGEICMDEVETEAYFENLYLLIFKVTNSIDYFNIDSPIQTYKRQDSVYKLRPNYFYKKRIDFEKNTFTDNIWLF